jgi:hypothetical protein
MKAREPFFGENAKAFALQALAAVVVFWAVSYFLGATIEAWAKGITRSIFALFE